jgi:hypothetical protein
MMNSVTGVPYALVVLVLQWMTLGFKGGFGATCSPSTQLQFLLPFTIRKNDVEHCNALFGNPFENQHVSGEIEYIAGDACDEDSWAHIKPPAEKSKRRIYLVNRGNCPFAVKALYALNKFGSATIVTNQNCSTDTLPDPEKGKSAW